MFRTLPVHTMFTEHHIWSKFVKWEKVEVINRVFIIRVYIES